MGIRDLELIDKIIERKRQSMAKKEKVNQFDIILQENNIDTDDAIILKNAFGDLGAFLEKYEDINRSIEITSVDQVAEMKLAASAYKEVNNKLKAVEKVRKEVGGKFYSQYKAVNAIANWIKTPLLEISEPLNNKAKFRELEQARIELEKKNEWVGKFREKTGKIILLSDITGIPEKEIEEMFNQALEEKLEADRIEAERQRLMREQEEENELLRRKNQRLEAEKKRYNERVSKLAKSDIHFNPDNEMYSYDDKGFFTQEQLSKLDDNEFTKLLGESVIFVGKKKAEKEKQRQEELKKQQEEQRKQFDENLLKTRNTTAIVDNFESQKKNTDYDAIGELAIAFKNYQLPEMKTKRGKAIMGLLKQSLDKLPPWLEEIREKRKSELK